MVLGVLLGWAIAASLIAGIRLFRPPRVISSERRAMQEALHAATVTLPHLRRGLSADSAAKTVGPLRTLDPRACHRNDGRVRISQTPPNAICKRYRL